MQRVFIIIIITPLLALGLESIALGIEEEADRPVVYRVTKYFRLEALADLYTLQFKFPLARRDLPNQRMSELYTDPKYNALINDPSGNDIAIFYFSNVKAGRQALVTISYKVEITVPRINFDPASVPDAYTETGLEEYLQSEGDVDIYNESIQNAVRSIVGDLKNPYLKGKAIYDFIVENIEYENVEHVSGVQRPTETLVIKRGNCSDITKLFVALCRASGIPCRHIDGVVFSANVSPKKSIEEAGHAWAEIYLPGCGWLPVDATFGISKKEEYYCFRYSTHIREFYGQLISRLPGSLYRGSSIEARTYSRTSRYPVEHDGRIEIELLEGL